MLTTIKSESITGRFLATFDLIPRNSRICIYGAGETGSNLKRYLENKRRDIKILFFIDSFQRGFKNGVDVIKIDDLNRNENEYDAIIIASVFWDQIEDILNKKNIDDYYILSNNLIYDTSMLKNLGPYSFTEDEYKKLLPQIEAVLALLNKPEEKRLYQALLAIRSENPDRGIAFLKSYDYKAAKYIDRLKFDNISTIIEGGVFDGADTCEIYKQIKKPARIYGFEPCYDVFANSRYKTFFDNKPEVKIIPAALWHKRGKLSFSISDNNYSDGAVCRSQNKKDGEMFSEIEAVSIDEFVAENNIGRVDLIKMDIEGSELEALKGAKNTLQRHRPQLAVSIYHKREHLYEIPLYLNSLLPDYEYRLSQYTPTFIDTVLYALPAELQNMDTDGRRIMPES